MSKTQFLDLQIKSLDSDGEQGVFTAYANTKRHVDHAGDCTVDNAYSRSIKLAKETGRMPKMLFQHDHNKVIGVWLEMDEDEVGLRVKGQLALNTTLGREVYELMKIGALDSLSIGYLTVKEQYDPVSKVTYLVDINIKEISIVTFACNEQSLVDSVKSEVVPEANNTEEVIEPTNQPESEAVDESILDETLPSESIQDETIPNETPNDSLETKLTELSLSIKLNSFLKTLSSRI